MLTADPKHRYRHQEVDKVGKRILRVQKSSLTGTLFEFCLIHHVYCSSSS